MIFYTSGVNREGMPFCHLRWGEESGQMTPDEVRGLAMGLFACAEAAESDAIAFLWAKEAEFTELEIVKMLLHFRRFRGEARKLSGDEVEP